VKKPQFAAVRFLGFTVVGAALSGCPTPQPLLQNGDASSAEIGYSGGDVASTLPIASRHCASYERVARLVDTSPWVAYYACDSR
jgi:hypothetical protein